MLESADEHHFADNTVAAPRRRREQSPIDNEEAAGAAYAALAMLEVGVVACRGDGRIVFVNPAAQVLLRSGAPLRQQGGKLVGVRRDDQRRLAEALESAAQGVRLSMASTLHLRETPLQVVVRSSSGDPVGGRDLALVFLSDPEPEEPNIDVVRGLFNLSKAEARVAALLCTGMKPSDIAGMLGVSIETVRTQLKSAYRRTVTSSATELAAVLQTGVACQLRRR